MLPLSAGIGSLTQRGASCSRPHPLPPEHSTLSQEISGMGHWAQLGDTGTSLSGLHTQLLIHTSAQLPPPRLSSVQGSVVSDSLRPHELQHARLPYPSPTHRAYSNSCPIESVMPSNHLILYHPLLLSLSIIPSIRVFLNDSVLPIRWPRYCSFSISPSNEYSGLISFRMDWLDLLAVWDSQERDPELAHQPRPASLQLSPRC